MTKLSHNIMPMKMRKFLKPRGGRVVLLRGLHPFAAQALLCPTVCGPSKNEESTDCGPFKLCQFKSSSEKEHFIEETMMEFESGDVDRS